MKGRIFDIQRSAIHDGPGIRSTVFFKGCNLKCFWCHNPESINAKSEVQIFSGKCIGCRKCFKVCSTGARRENTAEIDRSLCSACGRCVEACNAGALVMAGRDADVKEIMKELEKDRLFYKNSGGGITFSGGEPLLQKKFLKALLIECRKKGFHTAVDTALNVPFLAIAGLKPLVDLFLVDMKSCDAKLHKEATGAENGQILDNLRRLADGKSNIWIRIPVIPGFNDTVKDMQVIAEFLKGLKGIQLVDLLPFHQLAEGKYDSLGLRYKAKGSLPPSKALMLQLAGVFTSRGLPTRCG